MTIQTDRVQKEIFQDARLLQAAAVDRLDQGDIRDASEKAWGATKRATDALILARNGEEPELTGETSDGLLHLDADDNEVRRAQLVARYYTRQVPAPRPVLLQRPLRPLGGLRSAGSARRPTTSTTPSASLEETPCNDSRSRGDGWEENGFHQLREVRPTIIHGGELGFHRDLGGRVHRGSSIGPSYALECERSLKLTPPEEQDP